MLRRVVELYLASRKRKDNFWTEVLTRPVAAVALLFLARTRITPNQVTFLSAFTALGAAAVLIGWRTWPGLIAGAMVLQLSYVLDCVDGQLARLRGIASPLGHLLDFLMDELKAFLILGAVAVRLFLIHGSVELLLLGLFGLVCVASGISITTFMRRPEYLAAFAPAPTPTAGAEQPLPRPSLVRRVVAWLERVARFLIHYPSWFFYIAIADRLEAFLYIYVAVHLVYLVRSFLIIMVRLGRPGYVPDTGAPKA